MSHLRISRSSVVFELSFYDLPLLRTSRHKQWTVDAYGRGKKKKLAHDYYTVLRTVTRWHTCGARSANAVRSKFENPKIRKLMSLYQ